MLAFKPINRNIEMLLFFLYIEYMKSSHKHENHYKSDNKTSTTCGKKYLKISPIKCQCSPVSGCNENVISYFSNYF